MIGTRGVPASHGGVERAVEELSVRLAERGHDVTVYCRSGYCTSRQNTYRGIKLRYLPAVNTKHGEAISHTFLAVLDALVRRYDVVHFHATGPALLSFVPRLTGAKVVVTVQGLDYARAKWGGIARLALRAGARASASFPHATVVVSRTLRDHYRTRYGKSVYYVPNGVDVVEPVARTTGAPETPYALFLGRIVPEKRVHDLIGAFTSLEGDVRLRIAGPSGHTDDYVARCRDLASSDSRISFEGPVYSHEKESLLAGAAVVCQPSELEGLPLAMLEAMAHGRCVLASDIAPHRELLDDGYAPAGALFAVGDVAALRDLLARLLADPDQRERLGTTARDVVTKRYGWDDIVSRTEDIYAAISTAARAPLAAGTRGRSR